MSLAVNKSPRSNPWDDPGEHLLVGPDWGRDALKYGFQPSLCLAPKQSTLLHHCTCRFAGTREWDKMAVQEPSLNKEGHVKYWRRCHQSFLPTPYTASDSTRLTFACFIVSALDLLSAPFTQTERNAIRTWVLSLQHPDGGFCGSSTHAFGGQDAGKGTANLAATFFALILLATAADGDSEATAAFTGVQRDKLLRWLRRLQRKDGSFGQNLWEGQPVGGSDMRHSYLASSVRWMLGAGQGPEGQKEDIDVVAMISHIRRGLVRWVDYVMGLSLTFSDLRRRSGWIISKRVKL